MKGKDLNVESTRTQEAIAKKVIENLYAHVEDSKKSLAQAEQKLAEALEKDINDIKEDDGKTYLWD